jgi:hypothetical protein
MKPSPELRNSRDQCGPALHGQPRWLSNALFQCGRLLSIGPCGAPNAAISRSTFMSAPDQQRSRRQGRSSVEPSSEGDRRPNAPGSHNRFTDQCRDQQHRPAHNERQAESRLGDLGSLLPSCFPGMMRSIPVVTPYRQSAGNRLREVLLGTGQSRQKGSTRRMPDRSAFSKPCDR